MLQVSATLIQITTEVIVICKAYAYRLDRRQHTSNVLVDETLVCITQGPTRYPPKQAAEETHKVTGRSLAQINSRLFELTGTLYLYHVLHLQVSHTSV
jgi:hypothetical protein